MNAANDTAAVVYAAERRRYVCTEHPDAGQPNCNACQAADTATHDYCLAMPPKRLLRKSRKGGDK